MTTKQKIIFNIIAFIALIFAVFFYEVVLQVGQPDSASQSAPTSAPVQSEPSAPSPYTL